MYGLTQRPKHRIISAWVVIFTPQQTKRASPDPGFTDYIILINLVSFHFNKNMVQISAIHFEHSISCLLECGKVWWDNLLLIR